MDPFDVDIAKLQTKSVEVLAAVDRNPASWIPNSAELLKLIEIAQHVPKLLARIELDQLMLETKDETIAHQAALLATLEFPVLTLAPEILCTPIIGPIDFERGQRLMSITLGAAARRSARYFILDLTGAVVEDPVVANCIWDVTRALALVGVEAMLTGVRADIARIFIQGGEQLGLIPTFPTLAVALRKIAASK